MTRRYHAALVRYLAELERLISQCDPNGRPSLAVREATIEAANVRAMLRAAIITGE